MPGILKVSENKFVVAVRNGIAVTMPLTVVGSLFLIFANLPFEGWSNFLGEFGIKLGVPINFTFGILGLVACAGVAYYLAESYKLDQINSVVLSLSAFLMLQATEDWSVDVSKMGSTGLFLGILTGIASVLIINFFVKHNIIIKMPDGVPEAVSKSFTSLIPGAVIITTAWMIRVMLEIDVNQLIQQLFSPLAVGLNTLPGMLLYVFVLLLLWCAGIHGSNVMGSMGDPIFLALFAANSEAFAKGDPIPNIFAGGFYIVFLCYGSIGSTLGLIINMWNSKVPSYRSLARMALPSAIFCINEPIIFGFPIVMNPIMMIPFILTPLVLTILTYFLTVQNIIGRIVVNTPWTTPPIINHYLSTGGNIGAVIWGIVSIFISVAIYYPFFKISEKQELESGAAVVSASVK
ncbi:PTS sugar transporter subunit IIC [Jeotgalibaca caeni]|uniref:PTS sugar transporter subunit IIC n=1 Tax=Jeotgalibaca caeni TaxID=3028623 RepID=UPI00237E77A7|nr:PTS transporter subunit EIIC [Jeotgalibaca caeni]MDE1549676.1 PTS transporter subunit EIIC [Jeotgalibaca caeni]